MGTICSQPNAENPKEYQSYRGGNMNLLSNIDDWEEENTRTISHSVDRKSHGIQKNNSKE